MREIRTSGSEGGGSVIASPYPYRRVGAWCLVACHEMCRIIRPMAGPASA